MSELEEVSKVEELEKRCEELLKSKNEWAQKAIDLERQVEWLTAELNKAKENQS